MRIYHHSNELKDLILLQVPENCELHATAKLKEQLLVEQELFPTSVIQFRWPDNTSIDIKSIIRRTAQAYAKDNALTYQMITSSTNQLKSTTITLTYDNKLRTSDTGDPIPSSLPYVSINVSDDVYSITTDDGVTFSVLKNGKVLMGDLPSTGFALGTVFSYLLSDLSSNGSPDKSTVVEKDLTADFIYSMGKMLLEGGNLNESAERYLVDFVEMATNKDFGGDRVK